MIDWTAFTWEAFATLTTGLAAVLAATVVTLRQLKIVKRQTELLEWQARNDSLANIWSIYKPIREALTQVIVFEDKPTTEQYNALLEAASKSDLICDLTVSSEIWKIPTYFDVVFSTASSDIQKESAHEQLTRIDSELSLMLHRGVTKPIEL